MSAPDTIFAVDGESPYYYHAEEEVPPTATRYIKADIFYSTWEVAVKAQRENATLSRKDFIWMVSRGPDWREDVQAARRLIKKGRYK